MAIKFIENPYKEKDVEGILHPFVREWFFSKFKEFSLPQLYGVMEIHQGNNILVSAPTGATKCVTPDTTILIELDGNTRLLSGEELIKIAKNNGRLLTDVDRTGKLYDLSGLKCYSLINNKVKKSKAMIYFEETEDTLLKLKTEYGREVKLSKDHPLLVEGKGWISAKDIKVGNKIGVPRQINLPEKEILLPYEFALDNLKKNSQICILYEDYLRLRNKTDNFNDLECLGTKDLYEIKTLTETSFSKLSKELDISLSGVYRLFNRETNHKKQLFFNLLKSKCRKIRFERNRVIVKSNGVKTFSFIYPEKVDVRLARWLSFVLAEGLMGDYKLGSHLMVSQINRKELLSEFFKNSNDLFDIEFKQKNYKDYVFNSTLFCYFLRDLLNIKLGRGRFVEFPYWILNSDKEIKINFLNVFFSLESTIPKNGKEIILSQSNKNKIETINYLLLSLGIFSSMNKSIRWATNTKDKIRREYYYLIIRKIRNIKTFLEVIGIDHPNKSALEKQILKSPSGESAAKYRFDYKKIRNLSKICKNDKEFKSIFGSIYETVRRTGFITEVSLLNLKSKLIKFRNKISYSLLKEIDELLNNNVYWLKVKSIEKFNYNGKVVDLTVPDAHNFIGGYGGIYLHNTLTAFLAILNELVTLDLEGGLKDKVYAVYVSPLKALSKDIEVNLLEPLEEINKIAKKHGKELNIRIGLRTGDTSVSERAKMARNAPHIFISTPESLAIVLTTTKFREYLRDVGYCIVDEIHALADNKRGVHLSLTIERLRELTGNDFCRIGLSATISPLDEVGRYLVGSEAGSERNCKIADVQFIKKMDLKVLSPVKDLINTDYEEQSRAMYELIDSLIQEHKTTLIFTNTRSATERVVHHLKERFPKKYSENIGAHHGSLSKEKRLDIENKLREGKLKIIACSTSLELGIDIGYIDLVILLGSPKSVARCLQRIGRSGHRLHETAKGRIIVLDRDDLIECSVMLKSAIERKIDTIHIPKNCLDVLAQQIYGIAIADRISYDNLFKLIKRSYPYKNLDKKDFDSVLDYLSGEFTSLEDRHVYAKIWWDKETGIIGRKGKLSRIIYMTNIGTIPDEAHVTVKVGEQIIGHIDEGFLERLKTRDVFVLGGERYEFQFARGMVAQVKSTADRPPTIPSWFSEMLPLSFDLGLEIGKFRRLLEEKFSKGRSKEEIIKFIDEYLYVDRNSAEAIYRYFNEMFLYVKEIPNDKKILIEHYTAYNKKFAVFHTLYGRRVNDVLSRAVAYLVGLLGKRDIEIGITDNGFYLGSEDKMQARRAFDSLKSKDLDKIMEIALEKTEVLRRRFRHCAGRSLMILREYKGRKKRVGRQQVSSMLLISAVKRISNDFPILKEARREVLEDLMDVENAREILKKVENGEIKVKEIDTKIPSPFGFNLVLQGYADVFKMEDRIEFLKRMHQLVLAKIGKNEKIEVG